MIIKCDNRPCLILEQFEENNCLYYKVIFDKLELKMTSELFEILKNEKNY